MPFSFHCRIRMTCLLRLWMVNNQVDVLSFFLFSQWKNHHSSHLRTFEEVQVFRHQFRHSTSFDFLILSIEQLFDFTLSLNCVYHEAPWGIRLNWLPRFSFLFIAVFLTLLINFFPLLLGSSNITSASSNSSFNIDTFSHEWLLPFWQRWLHLPMPESVWQPLFSLTSGVDVSWKSWCRRKSRCFLLFLHRKWMGMWKRKRSFQVFWSTTFV